MPAGVPLTYQEPEKVPHIERSNSEAPPNEVLEVPSVDYREKRPYESGSRNELKPCEPKVSLESLRPFFVVSTVPLKPHYHSGHHGCETQCDCLLHIFKI